MKLNVTNNRSTPLYIETRGISIDAGESIVLSNAGALDIAALKDESEVDVSVDYEDDDFQLMVWEWVTLPAGSGGATESDIEGRIVDQYGLPIAEERLVHVGVFDDAICETAAVNATLDTAAKGSIEAGGGSAELLVKTSTDGEFACTLTDAVDETVYLAAKGGGYGQGVLDGQDVGSVEFSA